MEFFGFSSSCIDNSTGINKTDTTRLDDGELLWEISVFTGRLCYHFVACRCKTVHYNLISSVCTRGRDFFQPEDNEGRV
jgi:hypothetical protein